MDLPKDRILRFWLVVLLVPIPLHILRWSTDLFSRGPWNLLPMAPTLIGLVGLWYRWRKLHGNSN
jgi:hypothetical protein